MLAYPARNGEPEIMTYQFRLVGGTTSIAFEEGDKQDVTVARTGTGAYRLTWGHVPGKWVGVASGISATTVADVAGHDVKTTGYDATNKRLDFTFFNASQAAHDLAAAEWITLHVSFQRADI